MSYEITQESVEPLRAEVLVDGTTPTDVAFAVVPAGTRAVPGDYVTATADGGSVWSVPLSGLPQGWYDVWVRVDQAITRLRRVFEVV